MPRHAAGISPKQRRFVAEFLASGNATDAARRAGYSENSAHATGYKLIRRHPAVQAAIKEAEADRLAELQISAGRLDETLKRITDARSGVELELLGCTGRDQIAAIKLLYERLGLGGQRLLHRVEALDWKALLSGGPSLDDGSD